ncbi:TetR/AcrR family transcriptional regulator [Nakamurella leprariae]|uniref:TetR/AcrR family transcriptional regulator n=1 Tax=Nakamurella leprariae TaxID=2803911 RepID=A0A939BXL7_9ACTN|nr:TetR/AcrR family transcriptional regulator [Nakamurella leprariae]MBM9465716.1 TetR/AcrR family transcriptional regulator [Nakamurella leprariae]
MTGSTKYQQVVEAAAQLFADRGYRGTSMRDIADAVGLHAPSLYNRVHSKADVLRAIIDSALDGLVDAQFQAISSTPDVELQLRRAVEAKVLFQAQHPHFIRVLALEVHHLDEQPRGVVTDRIAQYEDSWLALINRGCASGHFRVASVELLVPTLLSMGTQSAAQSALNLSMAQVAYHFGDMAMRLVEPAGIPGRGSTDVDPGASDISRSA